MSKTSELAVYRRKPRARHDVGIEPLDWVRIGVVLTVVLLASGGGLATAGMLREGPLADIGSTDRTLEDIRLRQRPGPETETLGVGAAVPASACVLEVSVEVVETPQQVLVGPVRTREPRLPFTAQYCPDGVPRQQGRVYAVAELSREVGNRDVVDASNQRIVRVVPPRSGD